MCGGCSWWAFLCAMAAGIAGVIYAPLAASSPMVSPSWSSALSLSSSADLAHSRARWSAALSSVRFSLTTLFDPAYAQAAIYAVMALVLMVRRGGCSAQWGGRNRSDRAGVSYGGGCRKQPSPLRCCCFRSPSKGGSARSICSRVSHLGRIVLGFDLLFGRSGLLSFGQGAFYGTGGFVPAYLLTAVRSIMRGWRWLSASPLRRPSVSSSVSWRCAESVSILR